jgi:hypothetical protein
MRHTILIKCNKRRSFKIGSTIRINRKRSLLILLEVSQKLRKKTRRIISKTFDLLALIFRRFRGSKTILQIKFRRNIAYSGFLPTLRNFRISQNVSFVGRQRIYIRLAEIQILKLYGIP